MADLTQFDIRSARRIARVVQAVELEPRRASPLTFDPVIEQRSDKVFRVCTYTGDWPINASKTVTFSRINVPSLGTASTVTISVTTCSTATAS
jgi:hypothetical protein